MNNEKQNKFIAELTKYSGKLASNKYIMAIRDGFAGTIPITITAAFFLLINNVLLDPKTGLMKFLPCRQFLVDIGIQGYNATLGIMTLLVTFLIGYRLAKYTAKDIDASIAGIVAVACMVALTPNIMNITTINGKNVKVAEVLNSNTTSANGMIVGILSALLGVTIFIKLNHNKHLQIKMPDSVPPAVAHAFSSLFPSLLTISIFATVETVSMYTLKLSIPDLIIKLVQTPLIGGFQSLAGILFYVFISTIVFIFGIHGAFVFGSISSPILLTSLQQNIDAIKAGNAAPHIVTQPFLDAYVYMGGGGTMICLVIALFIFSRRKDQRMIAKLAAVPNLFNISEPMMYGVPIVFNPVYAIPFVLTPMMATILAYVATYLHLVNPTYIAIPWVTPPLLSGYLATGGDIRATILQLITMIIGVLIYAPFVIVSNRLYKKELKAEK